MTYCTGISIEDGLICASDTRTNAGVDHISTFKKLYTYCVPGERFIVLQTSGNLATSQAVFTRLQRDIDEQAANSLYLTDSLFSAASRVGELSREVSQAARDTAGQISGFSSSFLLGGQIQGQSMELYNVYPEGNCIAATEDTPFFQLGEAKYGKPILDRSMSYQSKLEEAVLATLISFDSTIRSNLSVGCPIDLVVYRKDSFQCPEIRRVLENDDYYYKIRQIWSEGLKQLLYSLPTPPADYL